MEKIKNITFVFLGAIITILLLWFFFFIALPILLVVGLFILVYFSIKHTVFFQKIKNFDRKRKKKKTKKKDDIQEAVIIEEK